MARTAFEHAVMSGVNLHHGAKFSDGTFPHNFWVSPNGYDGMGTGSGYGNGSFEAPFLTVRRAIREARDGRGDRVLVTGGSYNETIDIGASGTGYGPSGGYAKSDLQILGDDSVYNGRTQIIGDGSTAQATIRVQGGYLRGFVLANVELDTNGVTNAALHLITDDTGASPAATASNYRFRVRDVAIRSNDPDIGILLQGATLGSLENLTIQGPTIGIGFSGSDSNLCSDLDLTDVDFRDCVTADIATIGNLSTALLRVTPSGSDMTNVSFLRMRHWDRGGTAVTNFVNMAGTMVNVHFFDCRWARDVADDTLLALPANVVAIGHSAAGVESIIGS